MNVYTLRDQVIKHNPDSHFFDPDTLKFFGERWSEMRVLKKTQIVVDAWGEKHECWVLSTLQRKHPCGARRVCFYFDKNTFEEVLPKTE